MVEQFIQSMIEDQAYKRVEKFCRGAASVTTAAYPIAVFNLHALGISFTEEKARQYAGNCFGEFESFRNQNLV